MTYAELTMPRNKGYAQMRAKSTESPNDSPLGGNAREGTSTFRIERPRPQPPPRYTATPTMNTEPGSSFCSAEMPLVSSEQRRSVSSLPSVGKRSRSPPSPAAEGPQTQQAQAVQQMRHQKIKHRRTAELMDQRSGWSSVPETIGEEEEHEPLAVDPRRSMTMDIHEKRRIMMGSFRKVNTHSSPQVNSSNEDAGGTDVPPELLQKRKVLMKTLNQVRSQWSSMPAIDPNQAKAAMRLVQQQQEQERLQQRRGSSSSTSQRHKERRRPPPLDSDRVRHQSLHQQMSLGAGPRSPPARLDSRSSRQLPQVPPVRRIQSTGHFNVRQLQQLQQQQQQQQQYHQQQSQHEVMVGERGGGGYERVIAGLSRGKSLIVRTSSGHHEPYQTQSSVVDARLLNDARRAKMVNLGSLGQVGPALSTIHADSIDSIEGDLI